MMLVQSFVLRVAATAAFATNIARDVYPWSGKPYTAPKSIPIPPQYIDEPCEYNSDFDTSIPGSERSSKIILPIDTNAPRPPVKVCGIPSFFFFFQNFTADTKSRLFRVAGAEEGTAFDGLFRI